jgi:hypothetical protein
MERNVKLQNFSNAFNCKKCPGNAGPQGCPDWIGFVERDDTGKERYTEQCGRQAWPLWMGHVLAASNRPAAAIESTRNALVEALNGVGRVLDKQIDARISSASELKQIGDNNDQSFF